MGYAAIIGLWSLLVFGGVGFITILAARFDLNSLILGLVIRGDLLIVIFGLERSKTKFMTHFP